MTDARLVYLMGPSGSGKDSLLNYVREHIRPDSNIVIAHRYITRPQTSQGENHIALSLDEFRKRLCRGLFALHWSSHGLHYAIGIEINQWLAKGMTVLMNGSRAYLPEASRKYSEIFPVSVQVSTEVLAERLRQRGRESPAQIQSRLQRLTGTCGPSIGPVINNDRDLDHAGQALLSILEQKDHQPA